MSDLLPGRWVEFGPEVVHVAVHPTRPWLALVRRLADGVVVEHHDVDSRQMVSTTEAPAVGDALLWMGDRLALLVHSEAVEASYIDAGVGIVDVVHVRHLPELPQMHAPDWGWELAMPPAPWGLEWMTHIGEPNEYARLRLSANRDGLVLAITTGQTRYGGGWHTHPDGDRMAYVVFDDLSGAHVLDLQDRGTIRRTRIPNTQRHLVERIVGWSSRDRLVLRTTASIGLEESGPCGFRSVCWNTLSVEGLNAHIPYAHGYLSSLLSADGSKLAVLHCEKLDSVPWLTVIDAETGDLLARSALFHTHSLQWLGSSTVLAIARQRDSLAVCALSLHDNALARFTLPTPPNTAFDYGLSDHLRPIDGDRLLLRDRRSTTGRCFLSDPPVPR